jgi:hypothetical protein
MDRRAPVIVSCPQQTCAGAVNPCAQFPGATFSNCTDTGSGWAGSCCFAPGTPVCVTESGAVGCSSGGAPTGTSGPTTGPGGADAALPPDPGGPTGPDKGDAASPPPDPGQPDGGAAFQPDASACHYDVLPLSGGTCGVKGKAGQCGTYNRAVSTRPEVGRDGAHGFARFRMANNMEKGRRDNAISTFAATRSSRKTGPAAARCCRGGNFVAAGIHKSNL